MALVECHECGNKISTEAKFCPQCGAKNKKLEEKKAAVRIAVYLLLGGLAWWVYTVYETQETGGVPTCHSDAGRDLFKETFDGSPYAQKNKLRAVGIEKLRDVSSGTRPEDRACEVIFVLNDSSEVSYRFTFKDKSDGGYYVSGSPMR